MPRGVQSKRRLSEHGSYQIETASRVFFAIPNPAKRRIEAQDARGKVVYHGRNLEFIKGVIADNHGAITSCKAI